MNSSAVKSLEFLAGGGEMGERIRSYPWHESPLGDLSEWPQSLRTCVRIMLSSKQPIWIGWGPQLIKLYNDEYIDIVRGKHPGALGEPASVVWKDIWEDIGPMLAKAMIRDEGTYVEAQLLIMQRSGFPEETYYTFSYTPVLGEDGRPAGIICYNTADTDRILNERSLRTMQQLESLARKQSEQEVYEHAARALASNTLDFPFSVIYKVDEENGNASIVASSGIEEKDFAQEGRVIPQSSWAETIFEGKIYESTSAARWTNLPRGSWNMEPRHFVDVPIKSANRKYPLAILTVALNPYRKFDDAYRNFIQLIADQISLGVNNALAYEEERKRIKALEELDQAKTLFFTNISHEFRTPLMLMLSPLEEVLKRPLSKLSDDEKQNLEVTHRNAMRLLKLVNTLLDFSRIESGRSHARFVPTDIGAYTRNLAANFRSVVERAGLAFIVDVDAILPPVYIDKQMWEKIVFNLLSNAFKFTLEGSITVKLRQTPLGVELSVSDSGVGIPEEELPRMFERFHRVQNSSGRTYEGTGIGLSLIREFVHLHDGTIDVTSKVGKGSTFTVRIPFGSQHLNPTQVFTRDSELDDITTGFFVEEAATLLGASQQEAISTFSTDTVLIVDDNNDMRQHIRSLIGKQYKTVTAANGVDALNKIATMEPALILSDIMMPEMDGIELLRRIKDNPETSHIPMILITARAGEESKIEGYEIGADDYLVKPFSTNELLARIKAQIRMSKARKLVQEKLEGYLMQMPAGVALVELPEFNYALTNSVFRKISGNAALGSTIENAFRKYDGIDLGSIFEAVASSGEPYTRPELPLTWISAGESCSGYFDVVVYPIKDGVDELSELMVHVVEATSRVESRKLIEASERQFRNVLVESPNLFAILEGPEMRITFVNDPLLNSWGRTSEIVGMPILEALPEIANQGFPEQLQSVYNTGEPFHGTEVKATLMKDGVPEDVYYNFVYQPIIDIDNRISGITIMAIDLTEQVLSRRAIEESEETFRTLTETLPQLVWMTDAKGKLQFTSKRWEEFAGFMPGRDGSSRSMLHPDDIANMRDRWRHSIATGETYRVEARLRGKSGEYRWYYGQGEPIRNEAGEIRSWIGAFTDIHNQKLFTDELESEVRHRTEDLVKANKELESFNYIASHDLQEPLRKIQTFIHLIDKNKDDRATAEKYYQKIYASAQRMSELIHSVLTYSRLSKTGEDFTEVDLNKIIRDIQVDFELMIAEREATIICSELPVIRANALQINQLFSNLVSNALKFSRDKPEIRISSRFVTGSQLPETFQAEPSKKYAHILFADNGIGFEQEFSEKIFSLFQRLHGKHEYSGTGIGLSIVKKIVEQHDGFVSAESEPGQGATFHIWLPA